MGTFSFINSPSLLIHFFITIVGIFLICVIMDLVRQKVLGVFKNTKFFSHIDKRLNNVNEKIYSIMEETK